MRIIFQVDEPVLLRDFELNRNEIERIVLIATNFMNSEKDVMLVTAGAIASAIDRLGVGYYPQTLKDKQAFAAIGQVDLIRKYQNTFDQYNQRVAQVLLSRNMLSNTVHRDNASLTFARLFELNTIPIINENDVVSTADIIEQDNTPLARVVADLSKADMLISVNPDHTFEILDLKSGEKRFAQNKEDLFDMFEAGY